MMSHILSILNTNNEERMTITEIVNNMTSEQYLHMLNVFFGEVPAEIANLSDDELLKELGV